MVEEFVKKKVYTTGDKVGQEILRSTENDRAFPEINLRLFEDRNLKISKWDEFSRHREKYPTIHLDFQWIGDDCDDYLGILLAFRNAITGAFNEHKYLLCCEDLWSTKKQPDRFNKEQFKPHLEPKEIGDMRASIPEATLLVSLSNHITQALPFLAQVLRKHYNHRNTTSLQKINDLLTILFQKLLKRLNRVIARALTTGISYKFSRLVRSKQCGKTHVSQRSTGW